MSARGRLHGLPAILIVLALVATASTPAGAQDRDCRTLRAFANADGRDHADLSLRIEPGSGVQLGLERGPADIPSAKSCDVEVDRNGTLLSCQWSFRDYAGAIAFYEPMLERLRRCLDQRLPAAQTAGGTQGWLVMRRNSAELVSGNSETQLELQLIEWDRRADAYLPAFLTYFVDLEVELSFEEAGPTGDEEAKE